MHEEYIGRLLEDGHLSIPKEVIDKLKIDKKSRLCVTVKVEKTTKKERILSYAGLLADLTEEEEKRFSEACKRRNLFSSKDLNL